MTATVRIYSYPGLVSAPLTAGGSTRPSSDSLYMLKQPYLAGEVLTADTVTAVTSDALTAPNNTTMLQVQIQPTKAVHYEITPAGFDLRTATANSPILWNDTIIHFSPGWRISLLEHT